jgi:hypothetical protein
MSVLFTFEASQKGTQLSCITVLLQVRQRVMCYLVYPIHKLGIPFEIDEVGITHSDSSRVVIKYPLQVPQTLSETFPQWFDDFARANYWSRNRFQGLQQRR